MLMKSELQRRGCVVETANDGLEALCKIFHFEPHIVLLDVWMPGLEGNALVKTIKAYRSQVGIIMASGSKNEKIKKECLQRGAHAYLEKPLDMDSLNNKIREILEHEIKPSPHLSESDLHEIELVLKLFEKKGLMTRDEILGEFNRLGKQ